MTSIDKGTLIEKMPFDDLKIIGVILFWEYPTTVLYRDRAGSFVIKEWADCDEDNSIDRYYYFSADKHHIRKFINGEILHIDLINSANNMQVYFQDEKMGVALSVSACHRFDVPENYLPTPHFKIEKDDVVDAGAILALLT